MPKYIDADAFEKSARQRFCAPCREKKEDYHGVRCRACWVGDMLDEVENAPAADVEPKRKTGQWIVAGAFDDFYQCPECGNMWPIFSTIEWKCCPICECKIITNRPKGEDNG